MTRKVRNGLFLMIGIVASVLSVSHFLQRQSPAFDITSESAGGFSPSTIETKDDSELGQPDADVSSINVVPAPTSAPQGAQPEAGASEPRRLFKRPPEPVLVGNAASMVNAALQQAETGDASSAYHVFRLLNACRMADLNSTADSALPAQLSGCGELPEELLQRRLEFLDKAARLGDINAQLDYGSYFSEPFADVEYLAKNPERFERLRSDVQQFLRSAAASGSVEALLRLGNLYEDGLLATQDSVQAFAYYWAVDRSGLYPLSGQGLVRLSQGMTQQEVLEATRRGQAIFERCCQQGW